MFSSCTWPIWEFSLGVRVCARVYQPLVSAPSYLPKSGARVIRGCWHGWSMNSGSCLKGPSKVRHGFVRAGSSQLGEHAYIARPRGSNVQYRSQGSKVYFYYQSRENDHCHGALNHALSAWVFPLKAVLASSVFPCVVIMFHMTHLPGINSREVADRLTKGSQNGESYHRGH